MKRHHRLFAGEVLVQGALGNVGPVRNLLHGDGLVAVLLEQGCCCLAYLLQHQQAFAVPATGIVVCSHGRHLKVYELHKYTTCNIMMPLMLSPTRPDHETCACDLRYRGGCTSACHLGGGFDGFGA